MMENEEGVPVIKQESNKYFQKANERGCVKTMVYYGEKNSN